MQPAGRDRYGKAESGRYSSLSQHVHHLDHVAELVARTPQKAAENAKEGRQYSQPRRDHYNGGQAVDAAPQFEQDRSASPVGGAFHQLQDVSVRQ